MVDLCHDFVVIRNLNFGTNVCPQMSKTECIVFTKKPKTCQNLKNVLLDGNALPSVSKGKHLGHVLESDTSMKC